MPIAPELKEILACPKCKGRAGVPRGQAGDRLQGLPAGVPHRGRHPRHAGGRGEAAADVTLAEKLASRPPARVLVIQTAYLGDTVFTSALVSALRLRFPQAEIDACVAPRGRDVALAYPGIGHVHVFDKRAPTAGSPGCAGRPRGSRPGNTHWRCFRTGRCAPRCSRGWPAFPSASDSPALPGRFSIRRGWKRERRRSCSARRIWRTAWAPAPRGCSSSRGPIGSPPRAEHWLPPPVRSWPRSAWARSGDEDLAAGARG